MAVVGTHSKPERDALLRDGFRKAEACEIRANGGGRLFMWQRRTRIPVAWRSLGGLSGRERLESGLSHQDLTCSPQNRTT